MHEFTQDALCVCVDVYLQLFLKMQMMLKLSEKMHCCFSNVIKQPMYNKLISTDVCFLGHRIRDFVNSLSISNFCLYYFVTIEWGMLNY